MSESQEIELASIPEENILAGMTTDELEKSILADIAERDAGQNDSAEEAEVVEEEVTAEPETETEDTQEDTTEEVEEEAAVAPAIDPSVQQILAQNQQLIQTLAEQNKQNNAPPPEVQMSKEELLEKLAEDPHKTISEFVDKRVGDTRSELKKIEEQQLWSMAMQNEKFSKLAPAIQELEKVYEGVNFKDTKTKIETLFRVAESLSNERQASKGQAKAEKEAVKKAKAKKSASSLPKGSKAAGAAPAKKFEDLSLEDMEKEIVKLGLGGDAIY